MRTNRVLLVIPAAVLMATGATAGEKKTELKDLPPAVQAAVLEQAKDLPAYTLSVEEEDGETSYEVESKVNGFSRDVHIDASGVVVEVEEEMDPARLPEPVRKAVEEAAGGGTIRKVEALTKGGATEYEVVITGPRGKSKFVVSGDGTIKKKQ